MSPLISLVRPKGSTFAAQSSVPSSQVTIEIFPKVVDGRDSLSGELRSIFEDHSCDHLRQQRAAVEFSP
ncbi:MAG: hypothetical protein ABSB42_22155, partial [Tepidisphaeraceae bacterium]